MILLDTSALLFWTVEPEKLSARAAVVIAEADRIFISSMSIWEVGLKATKGKLALPGSPREYLQIVENLKRTEILPVDEQIWLKNVELDWPHRDPADRTIVATATLLDCPLVTSDVAMRDFYPKAIW